MCFRFSSRFKNLDALGHLANLKALKLHNLRHIQDFSGLKSLSQLKYLSIDSQFDYPQPIEDFSFLETMSELEYLELGRILSLTQKDATLPFGALKALKQLKLPTKIFSLRDYALLDVILPRHIYRPEPIKRQIDLRQNMTFWIEEVPLPSNLSSDQYEAPIYTPKPAEVDSEFLEFLTGFSAAVQSAQGLKKAGNDNEGQHKVRIRGDYFYPLGKGARSFKAKDKNANKKVLAYIKNMKRLKLKWLSICRTYECFRIRDIT